MIIIWPNFNLCYDIRVTFASSIYINGLQISQTPDKFFVSVSFFFVLCINIINESSKRKRLVVVSNVDTTQKDKRKVDELLNKHIASVETSQDISKLPKISEEEAPFIDDRSAIEKKEEEESEDLYSVKNFSL